MPSWKYFEKDDGPVTTYTPTSNARAFVAVDASGSTSGSPIKSEQDFAFALERHLLPLSLTSLLVTETYKVSWSGTLGGTEPSKIFQNQYALAALRGSDYWCLLTDGEVSNYEVTNLARIATSHNVYGIPIIFVIVGRRPQTLDRANISVGVSFIANAPHSICLFKCTATSELHIIAAKGLFAPLTTHFASKRKPDSEPNMESGTRWEDIPMIKDDGEFFSALNSLNIFVPEAESRSTVEKGISLGTKWDEIHHDCPTFVDLELLLKAGQIPLDDLDELLEEEAFANLLLAYKIRGMLPELRQFLQAQKVDAVTVKLTDVAGAGNIVAELNNNKESMSPAQRSELQSRLRVAHEVNRTNYEQQKHDTFIESEAAANRNRLVDQAFRQFAEVEQSGYTADILSRRSNRARRAETVAADPSAISVESLDLSATGFRSECHICCGENQIMSLALRRLDGDDMAANTADFALDFPLAAGRFKANTNAISSQLICFQCALAMPEGRSVYNESLSAVLPALDYDGTNKRYIIQQLYTALNDGLKTGVPQLSQLFATILERTLRKKWASSGIMKQLLEYFLSNVIRNTWVRETFNELGKWVPFEDALKWVAKDFEGNLTTSFAVTYPIAGFMQLLSLGSRLDTFSKAHMKRMKATKVIYSVVSIYLTTLLKESAIPNRPAYPSWPQRYLALIYQEFNAELIPRDQESNETIVTSVDEFWPRLTEILTLDEGLLSDWDDEYRQNIMLRVQILVFRLLYFQRGHTSAKTFFAHFAQESELGPPTIDIHKELPDSLVHNVLKSIFLKPDQSEHYPITARGLHSRSVIVPYATPFGPSVMQCGFSDCSMSFLPENFSIGIEEDTQIPDKVIDKIRQARAAHMKEVFGVNASFNASQTGMPEGTDAPTPPNSSHVNLHIGVVRTWAALNPEERQRIIDDEEGARRDFFAAVKKRICQERRGNIYQTQLEKDARDVLPSFLEMLKKEAKMRNMAAENINMIQIDFEENKLEAKLRWEVKARNI
ncbi:hypothetical protein M501DRAFT_928421 [Patellaria atrata CBS 101060]|uniref:Uncharacterized protein n=1 Tax=Patellaria atrata CBS 101060 TaxID=1346257 RepID=A0A9P4SGY3_9PEZI|nr:hypothetical protein M501DRAFT_928421 [Patellaria atrata CBS 101060]